MSATKILRDLLGVEVEIGWTIEEHLQGSLEGANSRRPRVVFPHLKPSLILTLLEAMVITDGRLRINITPSEEPAFGCRAEVGFDRPVVG